MFVKYHCASPHLGKSEASAASTLPPLDGAGELNRLVGGGQAYAAASTPPSAKKRSPLTQLGSHAEKKQQRWGVFCGDARHMLMRRRDGAETRKSSDRYRKRELHAPYGATCMCMCSA